MKFLSLDPSVNNVGWTTFETFPLAKQYSKKGKIRKPEWNWGTWKLEGDNRVMRLVDLRDRINEDVGDDFDHLIIEYPAFYSSEKGQVAAHQNYTIDLACICGYIAGCFNKDQRTYHPMTAMEWKGSVKKEITARKFFRRFKVSPSTLSEHAIDSTMMLHYFLQRYGPRVFQSAGEDYPESPILRI